jgi:hypothetical protein
MRRRGYRDMMQYILVGTTNVMSIDGGCGEIVTNLRPLLPALVAIKFVILLMMNFIATRL